MAAEKNEPRKSARIRQKKEGYSWKNIPDSESVTKMLGIASQHKLVEGPSYVNTIKQVMIERGITDQEAKAPFPEVMQHGHPKRLECFMIMIEYGANCKKNIAKEKERGIDSHYIVKYAMEHCENKKEVAELLKQAIAEDRVDAARVQNFAKQIEGYGEYQEMFASAESVVGEPSVKKQKHQIKID